MGTAKLTDAELERRLADVSGVWNLKTGEPYGIITNDNDEGMGAISIRLRQREEAKFLTMMVEWVDLMGKLKGKFNTPRYRRRAFVVAALTALGDEDAD